MRPPTRDSEQELIEACRHGDREAFRELFETYKDSVFTIALSFTRSEAAAKDITQEVFLKLFSTVGTFRGDSSFATWLFRMVANACMDEHRRRRRLVPIGTEVDMNGNPSSQSQEQSLLREEVALKVRAAVADLSPRLRLPILLRYVQGLSYQEIAEVTGSSSGTVASRLNRGHKFLARRLGHLRHALGG